MIQRILNSKNFLAVVLAMTTGTLLYFKMPWPMTSSRVSQTWNEYFLRLIALRDPWSYAALKASYHILLFTTPYIGYLLLLSALYIFALRRKKAIKPQPLPPYPTIETRDHLYLVIGEIHNPRKPVPAEQPYWLTIPERGLFTGTILIGATGAGKTACSMYPFTEQLLGFKASDPESKLSGIILEVKGDFCRKVRKMLNRLGRKTDYIAISLASEWSIQHARCRLLRKREPNDSHESYSANTDFQSPGWRRSIPNQCPSFSLGVAEGWSGRASLTIRGSKAK